MIEKPTKNGWRPSQAEVADFLNTHHYGRISTLGSEGQPQIANVAFSQNATLELTIGTSETSRKAVNIGADSRVAFEVTDYDKRYTVQFEGSATRLTREEFEDRAAAHFEKLPYSLPFKDAKGQAYLLLKPKWVRFSDCSVYPWVLTEFRFEI